MVLEAIAGRRYLGKHAQGVTIQKNNVGVFTEVRT
jgi:hypothetical protein